MSPVGLIWGALVVSIVCACAPAKFVNPVQPVTEPKPEYESGKTDKPEVREFLTEKFRWKRASGQIHVAIVLHVRTGQERQVFDMVRDVVRTVDLKQFAKDKGYFDLVEQLRVSVLLEKDSILAGAANAWSEFAPKVQPASTIRSLVEDKVERAREAVRATTYEKFPGDPFESLDLVVRSAAPNLSLGPTTLHVIYVRAYENRQLDDDLLSAKARLQQSLAAQPWAGKLSTVSLLTYQNAGSSCKPDPDEMGTDVNRIFSGVATTSGELCTLSMDSPVKTATLNAIFGTIADRQGRLILRRAPKAGSLTVTVTSPDSGKRVLPANSSNYDGHEVLISKAERVQEGDEVEVTYEPM